MREILALKREGVTETREQAHEAGDPSDSISGLGDAFSWLGEIEIRRGRTMGPSRATPTPYVEHVIGDYDRETHPPGPLRRRPRDGRGTAPLTTGENRMRYDTLGKHDPAVMDRLIDLGYGLPEAHAALVALYLLEAGGSKFRIGRYYAVTLEIPPDVDAQVRADPETDRLIRDWWPILTNAVRARDIVRWECERERKRRERLRGKTITIAELFRQQAEAWRPHPDDVREWYRQKARERAES